MSVNRFTEEDIVNKVDKAFNSLDEQRAKGLEKIEIVQNVKNSTLESERVRLTKKYGADHPRVKKINSRLTYNQGFMHDLAVEIERAKPKVLDIDQNTWILHGFLRDKGLKGLPDLTVALYDQEGNRIRQLGYACTEKIGYFKISYGRSTDNTAEQIVQGIQVLIYILDKQGVQLYVDKRPVVPKLGQINYREIILDGDISTCRPPDDSLRPKFEETKEGD